MPRGKNSTTAAFASSHDNASCAASFCSIVTVLQHWECWGVAAICLCLRVSHAQAVPVVLGIDDDRSIDGVLLRESQPIPGATETLQYLQDNQIPFILLTNGGGKHEDERVQDLSRKLKVKMSAEQFVQSHTPFRGLASELQDKNILVTGSDAAKIRNIAEQYGFKRVITPADILKSYPNIWPFNPLMSSIYEESGRILPDKKLKIDGIFVYNDPRDWALDIQLIIDLLLSENGILGTYSSKNGRDDLPNRGWQSDGQPPLYFSNPDLFWAAGYHLPRFGQGAFQGAMYGVWKQVTGGLDLKCSVIGKPHRQTYEYAERVLNRRRATMLEQAGTTEVPGLQRVYMIGDNPESDIRGANEYDSIKGASWKSILVKTGVWDQERGSPSYAPTSIAENVSAAVKWALAEERYS
ncbi:hypothetical protein NW762_008139 [Fusarium torreyae]|uniref:HAD-superfamily subfamily IIA hydrolase n=1 Tax=Fusarium torreyae TaxID=1237075 RepID=A0A9W8RZ99_9HYPO|nr:hypothetical protein NW762_008139 [Fusarium torreyae]